jgi:hypothetical protein
VSPVKDEYIGLLIVIASLAILTALSIYVGHSAKFPLRQTLKAMLSPTKPNVAFPFEPLTELAEECSRRFAAYPLKRVPSVYLSPAAYFAGDVPAFYHRGSASIYFKDTFANEATPQHLAEQMMYQLIHAWMDQNLYFPVDNPKHDKYEACFTTAKRLLGLEKTLDCTTN